MLRELPRENCCRISPKYFCQSRSEKLLPNLTKNIATRAAQRELLPNHTKILLSKPSREITAAQRESLPNLTKILLLELIRKIASKSQQNIAVKAVQRNCCQISTKYCGESCPEKKHGTIPGKTKAAKTPRLEPTPSQSQLLSSEILIE